MTQVELGEIIGVTQQNLSKYENEIISMPIDVLISIANEFNVTTDYLLGLSDIKRDLAQQIIVNKAIDENYDLVESYKSLEADDREFVWIIINHLKKRKMKRG